MGHRENRAQSQHHGNHQREGGKEVIPADLRPHPATQHDHCAGWDSDHDRQPGGVVGVDIRAELEIVEIVAAGTLDRSPLRVTVLVVGQRATTRCPQMLVGCYHTPI